MDSFNMVLPFLFQYVFQIHISRLKRIWVTRFSLLKAAASNCRIYLDFEFFSIFFSFETVPGLYSNSYRYSGISSFSFLNVSFYFLWHFYFCAFRAVIRPMLSFCFVIVNEILLTSSLFCTCCSSSLAFPNEVT